VVDVLHGCRVPDRGSSWLVLQRISSVSNRQTRSGCLPRAPQQAGSRASPGQVSRDEPDQKTASHAADMAARLARAEAALDAERAKVDLLQRNLDDLRRMLPAPDAMRRRWWPW